MPCSDIPYRIGDISRSLRLRANLSRQRLFLSRYSSIIRNTDEANTEYPIYARCREISVAISLQRLSLQEDPGPVGRAFSRSPLRSYHGRLEKRPGILQRCAAMHRDAGISIGDELLRGAKLTRTIKLDPRLKAAFLFVDLVIG